MNTENSLEDFLLHGDRVFLPQLSVDCVIFGFHEYQLKVLLLKWKKGISWSLPGGFVKKRESLDDSASRTLRERTGLDHIFLQQFYAFGNPDRDRNKKLFASLFGRKSWIMNRFVTVGYYSLVEFSKVSPKPDTLGNECRWWDLKSIPRLIFDHHEIVLKALETLRASLQDHPVGFNLLPHKFTMPELQRLYETILNRRLDRRNFQKKILAMGVLDRLKERKTGGAHKAPYLYKFNKRKYQKALKEGLRWEW